MARSYSRSRSTIPPTIDFSIRDCLDSILEWSGAREDWRLVSRWAVVAWLVFYVLFLIYAFNMHVGYLFIDSANLVVPRTWALALPLVRRHPPPVGRNDSAMAGATTACSIFFSRTTTRRVRLLQRSE